MSATNKSPLPSPHDQPKDFNKDITHENIEEDFTLDDIQTHKMRIASMQSNIRTMTPHQPNDENILIMVHECQDKIRSRIKIAECTGNTTPERNAFNSKIYSADQFQGSYHSRNSGDTTNIGSQGYKISLPQKQSPKNAKYMDRMDTVKDALMETSRYPSTMGNYTENEYQQMKIKGKIKIRNESQAETPPKAAQEAGKTDSMSTTMRNCCRREMPTLKEEVLYQYQKPEEPTNTVVDPMELFRYNSQQSKKARCSKTSQKLTRPAIAQKFAELKALHNLNENLRQQTSNFGGTMSGRQQQYLNSLKKSVSPRPSGQEHLVNTSCVKRGWKQNNITLDQANLPASHFDNRGGSDFQTLQNPLTIKPISPPQQLPQFGIRFRGNIYRNRADYTRSLLDKNNRKHKIHSKATSQYTSNIRTMQNSNDYKSSENKSVKHTFGVIQNVENLINEYQQQESNEYEGPPVTNHRLGTAGQFPQFRQKIERNPPRNCQTSHAKQNPIAQKLTGTEPLTIDNKDYKNIKDEQYQNYSSLGPFSGRNIKSQPNNPNPDSTNVRNSFVTFEETGNTTYVKQDTTSSNRYSKKKPDVKELDIQKIQVDNIYVSPTTNSDKDSKRSLEGATPVQMKSTFNNPKPMMAKQKSYKQNKGLWNKELQQILNTVFQQFLKFHDRAYQSSLQGEGHPITFTMFKKYILSKYENDATRMFAKVVIESIQVLLKNQKYDSFSMQVPTFNDLQVQQTVQKLLERKRQYLGDKLTKVGEHCITEAIDDDTIGITPPFRSSREHTNNQGSPGHLRRNSKEGEQDFGVGTKVQIYHRPNLFDQSFDMLGSNIVSNNRNIKYVSFQRSSGHNRERERGGDGENPNSSNSIMGSLKNCDSFLDFVHTQNNSQYDSGGITSMKSKHRYKLQGWEVEGKSPNNLATKFQAYTVLTKPKGQVPALNLNKQFIKNVITEQAEKEIQKCQKLMPNGLQKRQVINNLKMKVRKYCPDSKLLRDQKTKKEEKSKRNPNSKVKRSGHWTSLVNEQTSQVNESIMQSTARGDAEQSLNVNASLEIKATGFTYGNQEKRDEKNAYSESQKVQSTIDDGNPESRIMHEHKMVYKLDPNCIQEEATHDIQELEETQKLNIDLNNINNNTNPVSENFNRIDLETVRLLSRKKDSSDTYGNKLAHRSRSMTPSKSRSNMKSPSMENSYTHGGTQDLLAESGNKYNANTNRLVFVNQGQPKNTARNTERSEKQRRMEYPKQQQRPARLSADERMSKHDYANLNPAKKRSVLMRSGQAGSKKQHSSVISQTQTREVLKSQTRHEYSPHSMAALGVPSQTPRRGSDASKSEDRPVKMQAELDNFKALVIDSLSPNSKSRIEQFDGLPHAKGIYHNSLGSRNSRHNNTENPKAATEVNTQRDMGDFDSPRKQNTTQNESYAEIQINQIALKEDLLNFSSREDTYIHNDNIHKTMNQSNNMDSLMKTKQQSIESPNSRKVTSVLRKSWDSQGPNNGIEDNLQTFRKSYKTGHISIMKKGINGINTDLDDVIEKVPKLRSSQQWSKLSKYRNTNSPSPRLEGDEAEKKKRDNVNPTYVLSQTPDMLLGTEQLARIQALLSPMSPSGRQFLFNLAGQSFHHRNRNLKSLPPQGMRNRQNQLKQTASEILKQNQLAYLGNMHMIGNTIANHQSPAILNSDLNIGAGLQAQQQNLNPIINFNTSLQNKKDQKLREQYTQNLDLSIMELRKLQKENARLGLLALHQKQQMQREMKSYERMTSSPKSSYHQKGSRSVTSKFQNTHDSGSGGKMIDFKMKTLTPQMNPDYHEHPFAAQSMKDQLKFMDNLKKLRNKILEQSQLESIRLKNHSNLQLQRNILA